ncbi:hypothetical protein [Chengkuizengella axinellae]|uniref:Copper amine oxidase-like N-terminal domain-containing protein n=1 Tax=Chengkuizengella axinellae TaxID=3064388 RepID=A0ABT9J654_9BACL|nr:hypothetical protein [Chengkuizengella sp. 2205SS18-9]MDP5277105.1 hypothetical protein [Chengkuizengella sp. 2205SS18-9]
MKKTILFIVIGLLIASTSAFAGAAYMKKQIEVTIYPDLELYFNEEKYEAENNDNPGEFFNGLTYVPLTMIYEGTTYVPLRFFSNQMGVPEDEVTWIPEVPQIWVGGKPPVTPIDGPIDIKPPNTP